MGDQNQKIWNYPRNTLNLGNAQETPQQLAGNTSTFGRGTRKLQHLGNAHSETLSI